jgi:hypothetical protein
MTGLVVNGTALGGGNSMREFDYIVVGAGTAG